MQYEYKVVDGMSTLNEDELNKLGKDEWDLVLTRYNTATGMYTLVFKREDWGSSNPYFTEGGASMRNIVDMASFLK